jgi:predicted secreted Zn-dependent protease
VSNKKANYWPHSIIASIFVVIGLCVWTVNVAINNPVEEDYSYFSKYQKVDEDINKILLKERAFNKKYSVVLSNNNFVIGQNSFELKVSNKEDNSSIDGAKVKVAITRPHTSKSDQDLKLLSDANGVYKFEPFEIKALGRWQIVSRVTVGELEAFQKLEVNATN